MFKQFFLFLFILSVSWSVNAQTTSSDLRLIEKQTFYKKQFDKKEVKFLKVGKNFIIRYNPVSLTFSSLMYFYQKVISPQLSAGCSYEISCSNFSKKCISEYGLIKGVALSADRLTRCNQIAAYDLHPMDITEQNKIHDPVERYRWKRRIKK